MIHHGTRSYSLYGRWLAGLCVAGLALMYFALLVSPFERWVEAFEYAVTVRLNRFVLTDSVWDWTLLIVSSRFWLYLVLGVAVAGSLSAGRRMLGWDYGRVLAYALGAILFAGMVGELSDKISETIKRPLPINEMFSLLNVAKRYRPDLEMPDDTGLPDENVAALACLALLFLIRLPRVSLAIFGMTFLHCVGQISIGQRWFLDVASGFLFGGAFGGLGLCWGAPAVGWLERKSEEFLLSNFWWLLPKAWTRSWRFFEIDRRRLAPVAAKPRLAGAGRWEERVWRRIITDEVNPLFNLPDGLGRLLENRQDPNEGTPRKPGRYTRFLRLRDGQSLVLKIVWRFGGLWRRPRLLRRFTEGAQANMTLARLGFSVPQVHWSKEGFSHGGLLRYAIRIEERVGGELVDVHVEAQAAEVMRTLARLHAHESETWGPLSKPRSAPHIGFIWEVLRHEVTSLFRRISKNYPEGWPDVLTERFWSLFEVEALKLFRDTPPCFRLTHGDLALCNFKFHEGRIRMVDFPRVGFDLPGAEILRAVRLFGNGTVERRRLAWEAYFNEAGEERWMEFLAQSRLSLARHSLSELAHGRVKALTARDGAPPPPPILARWLEGMLSMESGVWTRQPDATNWQFLDMALDGRPEDASKPLIGRDAPILLGGPKLADAIPGGIDYFDSSSVPLRICHVASHEGVYRGGAVQVCRMATGMAAFGQRVSVIVNRPSPGDEDWEGDEEGWRPLEKIGIRVEKLGLTDWREILKLRRLFISQGFDVIHAHRDEALVACWMALRGLRRPVLVAQRGTITPPPALGAKALRSPRTRAVVAVSAAVGRAVAYSTGLSPGKIEVIYGSVDLEEFAPRAPRQDLKRLIGIPRDAAVVGSLSAYRKAKGLETLVQGLAPILDSRRDVYAVFLGKGVRSKLEPLARQLGREEQFRFLDHQSDVAEWLSIMDVSVVAATDREGLSGVLRESLAMGIPVISTDCAGNSEIVRDGETGLLVPPDDVARLSSAIDWALSHPDRMAEMARVGRKWVVENCSTELQAEKLDRLYREILRSARPAAPPQFVTSVGRL